MTGKLSWPATRSQRSYSWRRGRENVRRSSNGGQWRHGWISPGGWVGGSAVAKIRQLKGSPVGRSGRKAEGRRGAARAVLEAPVWKEEKGRGARRFYPDTRRWGTVDGVTPCSRRGPRERVRGWVSHPGWRAAPDRQCPEAGGRERCAAAMPHGWSEQGRPGHRRVGPDYIGGRRWLTPFETKI
jgi:hypothetical protein